MKKLRLAILGFGSMGQSFAKILLEKKKEIEELYDTSVSVVAITTKTRGNLVDAWGIDLERVLGNVQETGVFPKEHETIIQRNSMDVAEMVDYDVLIELTPLEVATGQMATDHIKAALNRGKHVITANKGPLAWHYEELRDLAKKNNCRFLFETAVLDGAPLFSALREGLKMCKITDIKGILNGTTNYILQGLEQGKDMKDIINEGKKRGFMESNYNNDIDGTEAGAKMVALANVVMDAKLTPNDISITGIENITKKDIDEAAQRGNVIKLMCRAYDKDGKVNITIAPEEISNLDVYATVTGASLAVSITTDLMGTLTMIEESAGIEQGGYGLFADVMAIVDDL